MFVRRKRGQVAVVHSRRVGGRVRQQVIATFASAAELEETLGQFDIWQAQVAREYPDVEADWDQVRADLARHRLRLEAEATPLPSPIADFAEALAAMLSRTSPARAGDRAMLDQCRPALARVADQLDRVLGRSSQPADLAVRDRSADEVFDEGMEQWWSGDRDLAIRSFREVHSLDPLHADAHNHLGLAEMELGRLDEAEAHFRCAVDGGARHLEADGGFLPWGMLENRPYLRAQGNLAHVLAVRGRWDAVARIYEQLLAWNPRDNQGVRYLLGDAYHRLGRTRDAIAAYERADEDAGPCFGLALALLESGRPAEADRALIRGMVQNRYVAPMLLGRPWTRVRGWHGSNVAEPEWAADYVRSSGDLWRRSPHLPRLVAVHGHPAVQAQLADLDDWMVAMEAAPSGEARRELLASREAILGAVSIARVERALAGEPWTPRPLEPPSRFARGGALVVDLRHWQPDDGDPYSLPAPVRRLATHVGGIVTAVLEQRRADPVDTRADCRRRPGRHPCGGSIRAQLVEDTVEWACPRCGDHGFVTGWSGTIWDAGNG